MNYSDSERIVSLLKKYKLKPASNINEADFVVFNTCGVRQSAEDRAYGQIHNLHRHNPKIKIILTGCLANRKDVQRRLKDKVDLFSEIKDFSENFKKSKILNTKYKIPHISKQNCSYLKISPKYTNKHTAYVPIMTGCNNFCAYCIVPYARGREVSRPEKEIINEIKMLVKNGCKEIFLLGQNVNSYSGGKINFSKLLKKINAISGDFWIRFMTSHPKDMSDELIETIAKSKKVCEYIHLPVQSGDNEILQRMNRKYTREHYLKLIKKIRDAFRKYKPGTLYAITTDIIVGFPGETRAQFLKTADIMKKIKYDVVYFGQFSPRPETAAWKMKDNVSRKEKEHREKYLNEILKKTALENNNKYTGRIIDVLVEKEKNGFYIGKTRTMKDVRFALKKKNIVGKIVKVKIIKANAWNLEAEIK